MKQCGTCRWYSSYGEDTNQGDCVWAEGTLNIVPNSIKQNENIMHFEEGTDCPCWEEKPQSSTG